MEKNKQEEQEKTVPTQEQVVAFYTEQIATARLRAELAELNALTVEAEVRRMKAAITLANIKTPPVNDRSNDNGEEVQAD